LRGEGHREVSRLFKSLASPVRLSIIEALNVSEMNFSELIKYAGLGEETTGRFTYHLKMLARTGIVKYSSETRTYFLSPLGRALIPLLKSLSRGGYVSGTRVQNWDYSLEPLDMRVLSDYLVKDLRIPVRLARRVSFIVEEKLKELRIDTAPRWLVEELVREELIHRGVGLARFHNITPCGPSINEAYSFFRRTLENCDPGLLLRYAYESFMRRLVVERFFPPHLKDWYVKGEIDIHPTAGVATHVLALLLDLDRVSEEPSIGGAAYEYLYVRCSNEESLRGLLRVSVAMPARIYRVIEYTYHGRGYASRKDFFPHSRGRIHKILEGSDFLLVAKPLSGAGATLYTAYTGGPVFISHYAILPVAKKVNAIHAIICLNVLRLAGLVQLEGDDLRSRASNILEVIGKFLNRCASLVSKLYGGWEGRGLTYILAPVGLVELFSLSGEDGYVEVCQTWRSLLEALQGVPTLYGSVIAASRWPPHISERLYSIDRPLHDVLIESRRGAIVQPSGYSASLDPMTQSLSLDQLKTLTQLLGGMVLDATLLERLIDVHGRDAVNDFVQSQPILVSEDKYP